MDAPRSSRLPLVTVSVVALLVLPAIYVLSIGPSEWLFLHGYLNPDHPVGKAVIVIFSPIVLLMNYSPAFKEFIAWYVGLWV